MRLVTYSHAGSGSRLGVEGAGGTIHDLTAVLGVADVGEMLARGIAAGDVEDLRVRASAIDPDEVVLQAPVRRPGKIICVGLNYHDHCREQGVEPPAYPILFSKFANAVTHPDAPVTRPAATEQLDLECELAVVIGRRTSRVHPSEALEAVFGYTILNDVTMRDLQREDRQWLRAKGSDGFAPMGPVVVTADELGDPQALRSPIVGERRDLAGLEHRRDDLRRPHHRGVRVADDHAGAGRRDRHRHAGGRRALPAAATLPGRW